jgi:uracil-DNA glycosylase family 4
VLSAPASTLCIEPDGPVDADVLFIGEAPGKQENQKGKVFIGKTGDEVDRHYLPLAGLRRDRVRITNAIRCYPVSSGGKLDPKSAKDRALLDSCSQFLGQEILHRRVIVPMGSFACKAVCPEIDLEHQHGIPLENENGLIFPMYHPALGIYEPKKMLLIRTDWMRLKQLLHGTLQLPYDPYPTPDYREVTDASEIRALDRTVPLAGDTESTRKRWNRSVSLTVTHPGSGRLITCRPSSICSRDFKARVEKLGK